MAGFEYFVGIDWGSQRHQACVVDGDGQILAEKAFPHSGDGLVAMTDWLGATTNTQPHAIGVAIEVPHGPVVETMMERGFTVHALNPKQLDRFRDRWSPAGAKDDRRDAWTLAKALHSDDQAFRQLDPAAPEIVELREWSRIASDLTRDQTRLVNRARQQLWRYYPQFLKVESNLARPWVRELWNLASSPEKARRLRATTVAKLLKRHRVSKTDAQGVLERLRETPLAVAPGTTEAAVAHLQVVWSQLAITSQHLAKAYREMDRLTAAVPAKTPQDEEPGQAVQRDVDILNSLPGIGRIVLATLLAEAHDAVGRRDYQALRCLCGTAPVTKRSGKSVIVVRRLAAHNRLQHAVYHWANVAIQHDAISKSKYAALRARGHRHGRALRGVADGLLRVTCAMLENRTLFDPALRCQVRTA